MQAAAMTLWTSMFDHKSASSSMTNATATIPPGSIKDKGSRARRQTGVACCLALMGAWVAINSMGYGLRINITNSMPVGLYLATPLASVGPSRGDWVEVCIPSPERVRMYVERGYLEARKNGACPVGQDTSVDAEIKPIAALPGDVVSVTREGVSINDVLIEGSVLKDTDSQGRPIEHLPIGTQMTLGAGQYMALSTRIVRSLDSRYYGPVARSNIKSKLSPLIVR